MMYWVVFNANNIDIYNCYQTNAKQHIVCNSTVEYNMDIVARASQVSRVNILSICILFFLFFVKYPMKDFPVEMVSILHKNSARWFVQWHFDFGIDHQTCPSPLRQCLLRKELPMERKHLQLMQLRMLKGGILIRTWWLMDGWYYVFGYICKWVFFVIFLVSFFFACAFLTWFWERARSVMRTSASCFYWYAALWGVQWCG